MLGNSSGTLVEQRWNYTDCGQSSNLNNLRALDSASNETADQIIRDILEILEDTRPPEEISPSGELYRFIERYHRSRGTEIRPNQELPSLRDNLRAIITMSSETDPDRRRRLQRDPLQLSPLFAPPPQPQGPEPNARERISSRLSALARRTGRPRIMPTDRFQGQRAWRENNASSSRSNFNLGDIGEARMQLEDASNLMMQAAEIRQLEDASSSLRARLDDPLPSLPSPGTEYPDDTVRRVKRRKLNPDKMDTGFQGFSYGRYGQVEPGKLKMEIVSCDGGIFEMHRGEPREEYEPENVLLDDTSVYCTKSNRCNLVLRHQGNTTFCLTELIIKAPHKDYTAPYVFLDVLFLHVLTYI